MCVSQHTVQASDIMRIRVVTFSQFRTGICMHLLLTHFKAPALSDSLYHSDIMFVTED
jgi:hypothetical protein